MSVSYLDDRRIHRRLQELDIEAETALIDDLRRATEQYVAAVRAADWFAQRRAEDALDAAKIRLQLRMAP